MRAGVLQAHNFVVDYHPNNSRPIAPLLTDGSPSAIAWRVWAIVINSINRVLTRWFHAHIFDEIVKLHPAIHNVDTASPVFMETLVPRTCAAFYHANPATILGRPDITPPYAMPVGSGSFARALSLKATAAFRVAGLQRAPVNSQLCATVAPTQPACHFRHDIRGSAKHDEPTEPLPRLINQRSALHAENVQQNICPVNGRQLRLSMCEC